MLRSAAEVKSLNAPRVPGEGVVVGCGQEDTSSDGAGPDSVPTPDCVSLRLQKYLASCLASSPTGQEVLASAVDEGTRSIINAFILAVQRCE